MDHILSKTIDRLKLTTLSSQMDNTKDGTPLEKDRIHVEQGKELSRTKSKLKALMKDKKSGYYLDEVDGEKLIMHD